MIQANPGRGGGGGVLIIYTVIITPIGLFLQIKYFQIFLVRVAAKLFSQNCSHEIFANSNIWFSHHITAKVKINVSGNNSNVFVPTQKYFQFEKTTKYNYNFPSFFLLFCLFTVSFYTVFGLKFFFLSTQILSLRYFSGWCMAVQWFTVVLNHFSHFFLPFFSFSISVVNPST